MRKDKKIVRLVTPGLFLRHDGDEGSDGPATPFLRVRVRGFLDQGMVKSAILKNGVSSVRGAVDIDRFASSYFLNNELPYLGPKFCNVHRKPLICCLLAKPEADFMFLHVRNAFSDAISPSVTNEGAKTTAVHVVGFYV